jgi:alpha-ketoglutarate-dependent taurine dioxygenase
MNCVALHPFGQMLCVSPSAQFSDIVAAAAPLVNQYWLVIFRGREISEAEHLELMRVFGKPSSFAFASNDPSRGAIVGTSGWHTDGPYATPSGLVGYSHMGLYCIKSPRLVSTSFLSTPSFLDRLPGALANSLRELDGISVMAPHYYPDSRGFHLVGSRLEQLTLSGWENRNEYRHPIVFNVNGASGLHLHMGRLCGFVRRGAPLAKRLDATESTRLLGLIHDALDKSVDVYEHDWIENDFALVDNRLVAHLGHPNAGASVEVIGLRVLRRAMAEMAEERPWRLSRTPPRRWLRTTLKRSASATLRVARKFLPANSPQ